MVRDHGTAAVARAVHQLRSAVTQRLVWTLDFVEDKVLATKMGATKMGVLFCSPFLLFFAAPGPRLPPISRRPVLTFPCQVRWLIYL